MRAQSARMHSPRPVRIELRSSRVAALFVAITHIATAGLLAWLPLDAWLRAIGVVAVGMHGLWALRRSALLSFGGSIVAMELGLDRRVALIRRDGGRIDGCAMPESYVGEWLATLVVRRDGSRHTRSLWLLPDMADADELRRFRVLLRLSRAEHS
jgi:hypothetical protein